MSFNLKELAAGLLFVTIGALFAGSAALNLRMGSTLNMGPGFFPVILGSILILLGIAIALTGRHARAEPAPPVPWRGLGLIMAGIVFFGLTVRGLGFGPSLFVTVALAAGSSGKIKLPGLLVLAAVLSVFSTVVFIYALGLPYPVLGRWLGG